MFYSCTKKYTDESDEKIFRFTFYCDKCGKPHSSAPLPFSEGRTFGGGKKEDTPCENELWELLWQKEHEQAFDRANHEASFHFFRCPGCGEYACGDCTVNEKLDSNGLRELCCQCSRREGRGKSAPMKMVMPHKTPSGEPEEKKKGWRGLWKNKDYRRSQNE